MTHLAFELFSDVNAAHPYITVYLLEDGESYDPTTSIRSWSLRSKKTIACFLPSIRLTDLGP